MFGKIDFIIKNVLAIDSNVYIGDANELEPYGLDSLNFINLVIEIENYFGIKFLDDELVYSNFCTKSSMINIIKIHVGG